MRILYDHQIFQEQDFGGVSRYFTELYSNRSAFDAEIAVVRSDNRHLFSLPEMENRVRPYQGEIDNCFWGLKFRGKRRLYDAIMKITRRPTPASTNLQHSVDRIRSSKYDLFHPTYYDPYFLEALGNRPFVLTVHDLNHEHFPDDFPPEDSTALRKQLLCTRATRIISVSKTTKNDLVETLGIDPEKIDVVYHASSIKPGSYPESALAELPTRYILYTGSRDGYKNFFFFVRAIADILHENRSLRLVCTGPSLKAEERSLFDQLEIADRLVHRTASDAELAALYARAEMFVFPSLYEGFGMPTLEAFACGCPVVLSDTPAMREVAENAAIFFPPARASQLKSAVRRVLSDEALKTTPVERAHQREAGCTWTTAALETAEVSRRALDRAARNCQV